MRSVASTQFQTWRVLHDDNRLDVNDLSVRYNFAIEAAGMSPPRVRSAQKTSVALRAVVPRPAQIERFRSRILGDIAEEIDKSR